MNNEVRVVARETCSGSTKIRLILEPHLTHLAERQDKANIDDKHGAMSSYKNHTCPTSFYYKLNTNKAG
jgi:hypothetical protein